MSKVQCVLATSVAIDPADAHVEALRLELLREPQQRLSLLARHGSLSRTIRPDRPAFVVQRAPLAESTAEQPVLRLPNWVEKAKDRLQNESDGASSATVSRLARRDRVPDAPSDCEKWCPNGARNRR